MVKKTLLGGFIGVLTLSQGCKTRNDSSTKDAGVVGPNGEVVLFYRDGANIVIKQCEDYSVLKVRDDCKLKTGTSPIQVDVREFKRHLIAVLRMPEGNYDAEIKSKIDMYNKGEQGNIATLEAQKTSLKKDLQKIRDFIEAYGEGNANAAQKKDLETKLAGVEQQIHDNREIVDVIKEINAKVDDLVDQTISNPKMTTFVYSKDQKGFAFNILKSYLASPALSFQFKHIPKGTFWMGSNGSETDRYKDEVLHQVTIMKDFDMAATETTQMQWFSVMGDNPSYFSKKENCANEFVSINGTNICPSLPVENVSWDQVQVFISKLNQKSGQRYRLPTEAEWEYAARAGTTTPFNLGDNISPDKVNYDGNYPYRDAPKGLYRSQTVPVASLGNANDWGLSDMHGNVWEWVSDWYGDYPAGAAVDPQGSAAGSYRVMRGGSWNHFSRYCRSALRARYRPGDRNSYVGFRLVRPYH